MSRGARWGVGIAAAAVLAASLLWLAGLAALGSSYRAALGRAPGRTRDAQATPVLRQGVVVTPAQGVDGTAAAAGSATAVDADRSGRPQATATPTLAPAVDWPELPELGARQPVTVTRHFRVFPGDPADPLLAATVGTWAPRLEDTLAYTARRLGRDLPRAPVNVVFARAYEAACPARGLAAPGMAAPLLLVYVDEATTPVQVRAVLAHEMAHHLTADARFVGDGILTEGIAHWAAGWMMLDWQEVAAWEDAVRRYRAEDRYVSVTDDTALQPRGAEDCLARRDRVYNIRAAFVDWLIRRYGLATVLAMPYLEQPVVEPNGDASPVRRPDYLAATGQPLAELERRWLAELDAAGGNDG